MTARAGHKGAIVWAVAAFDAEEPFRIAQPDGSEVRFADARELAGAVAHRKMPGDFELIVGAKLRPVLLLQDRPLGRFQDFAALRLMRLERFAPDEQQRIRDGEEETLFYLGHDKRRYGLDKEHAVVLTSLQRIHRTAIATKPIGRLNEAELRTVAERVATVSELDLSNLVAHKAAEFVQRLRQQREAG
ncbi:MAG TPA: hypothetical protein VN238_16500 [Solirubrobacteraceae bacterium]|nr:hypothetical protein [Solirubrobacteraceae bacterium]